MRTEDRGAAEDAVYNLLRALGEDTSREGLRQTPARVVNMLHEVFNPPAFNFTTFKNEGMNEMILQKDIPFYSLCEHHIVTFFGTACVAYIPNGRIVGLSKLARAVQHCARGLQNQERITTSVADMLEDNLKPLGVGVLLRARHMCMEMRGVKAHGVHTVTSCLRGVFITDESARAEFLSLSGAK